jgi:hypothetical protein
MPPLVVRVQCTSVLAVLLLALCTSGAAAQQAPKRDFHSGMRWGAGYSGSIPDAYAGAGVWHLLGGGRIGLFVDGKTTVPRITGHRNYCPPALGECSITWVQQNRDDFNLGDENEWLILNAGAMYAFTPDFALLLGGGMARLRRVREYVDAEEDFAFRITEEGNYFVPYDPAQNWQAQAAFGLLMRASSRVSFSFGYETAPGTMTVGLFISP